MIHWTDIHPTEQVFGWKHWKTGEEHHFAVDRIWDACWKQPDVVIKSMVHVSDISPEFASFIATARGIEHRRLAWLEENPKELDRPMLMAEIDGERILIDGNHRYYKRWQKGMKDFTYLMPPGNTWRRFLVDMTGYPIGLDEMMATGPRW